MISLKETELCGNQGRTWGEGIMDLLGSFLDIPSDPGELLFFGVIAVVVVLVVLIMRALES
jgi:hypothetical protein